MKSKAFALISLAVMLCAIAILIVGMVSIFKGNSERGMQEMTLGLCFFIANKH